MPATDRVATNLTIAASNDWKLWLQDLARFTRSNRSTVIDAATSEFARARGFDRPAPPRCPGQEVAS